MVPSAKIENKEAAMSKVKLNYWLDGVIAIAFIASALSGVVFLFAGSGGYQGGRNPSFQTEMLGIERSVWSDLHTWVGLVMIVGVVIHLVLHWNWIVCMTKRMVKGSRRSTTRREQDVCPTVL
jgi:cytochrome b subunit of formate dehydrogenase